MIWKRLQLDAKKKQTNQVPVTVNDYVDQTCLMFLIKPSIQDIIKRYKIFYDFEIHNNHENKPQVRFLVAETGPDPPKPETGSKSMFL
jgi:hypothetical protein